MNHLRPIQSLIHLAGLCLLAQPGAVEACTACYGQTDSPLAVGMNWGIMTLLIVIGCVLAGVVSFFVYVGWRSSRGSPVCPDSSTAEN